MPLGSGLKKAKDQGHGIRAEKKLGSRLGGRGQPGSGAMEGAKGDIKLPTVLVESKSTVNKSLSLKHDWLKKITKEASAINCTPALAVQFVDGTGRAKPQGSWVAVPESVYRELLDAVD